MLAKLKDMVSSTGTEYECTDCGHEFTKQPRPEENPTCPECGSFDLQTEAE